MNMIGSPKIKSFTNNLLKPVETETSELLCEVFRCLDSAGIEYCVERNYEGYPDVLTGDLDLIVGKSSLEVAADEVLKVAKANGWLCYQSHIWERTAFLGLCRDLYPNRFTLTIEIFSGARWHGVEFLEGDRVVKQRLKHHITWKPQPAHQVIITAIHHLLYNNEIPEKYRDELSTLLRSDLVLVESNLVTKFGESHARSICDELLKENWVYFDFRLSIILKRSLLIRSIFSRPALVAKDLYKGLLSKRRNPEGVAIFIIGFSKYQSLMIANLFLTWMVRWHVFKPPKREIVGPDRSLFQSKRIIKKILASGGVAIVTNQNIKECLIETRMPSYTIVNDDKLRLLSSFRGELLASDIEAIDSMPDLEALILPILNAILWDRAKSNIQIMDSSCD